MLLHNLQIGQLFNKFQLKMLVLYFRNQARRGKREQQEIEIHPTPTDY